MRTPLSVARLAAGFALSLALAGCAGPASTIPDVPAVEPTVALSAPTAAPTLAPTAAAQPPAAEPPAQTVQAPADPLPLADGRVVLSLPAGSGEAEVGISNPYGTISGPPSFRIGADGSIRLLDALNRRVLFFTPAGELLRSQLAAEALAPVDFIVNNDGEVFVYDQGSWRDDGQGYTGQRVLRYGPGGELRETLPVNDAISGDGLMLTADQHLVLALGNHTAYLISHAGVPVPPDLQPATRQRGAATPRSPVLFRVDTADGPRLDLDTAYSGRPVNNDWRPLAVPADEALFFNVDRAMNPYLTGALGGPIITVRRLGPDGSLAGGARIDVSGCTAVGWRSFYIDQEGAAWTLCVGEAGATVSRYDLLDAGGAPLPAAATEAADVPWRPGATQNVAA